MRAASLSALLNYFQILRAYGLGELRLDNPNAYMVRKCLAKMYFHFKPEFWYWKIGIMVRKFLIVFAGTLLPPLAVRCVSRTVQGDSAVAHGEPVQRKRLRCLRESLFHTFSRPDVPQERHLPAGHDLVGGHRVLRTERTLMVHTRSCCCRLPLPYIPTKTFAHKEVKSLPPALATAKPTRCVLLGARMLGLFSPFAGHVPPVHVSE